MQPHPEQSEDPQPRSSRRAVLIGAGIAAILLLIVLLHVTGVVGPASR